MKYLFLLLTVTLNLYAQENVIYGRDNRVEVNHYDNPAFIEKARSVALRVSNRKLSVDEKNPNFYNFNKITLGQSSPSICRSERFIDQVTLGTCSGFLVGKDILLTAGHCMFSETDCKFNQWIFDYKEGTEQIASENIYSCKKIITHKYNYTSTTVEDYAVIQLDREVKNRAPLKVRKFGDPIYGTPLVLIGHPLGLPMKIADGAKVKAPNAEERLDLWGSLRLRHNYIVANLDSYAGNSGSPVFNQITGKVEGILIQGADDFTENLQEGCLESAHRGNSSKQAQEKIMRITKVPGV